MTIHEFPHRDPVAHLSKLLDAGAKLNDLLIDGIMKYRRQLWAEKTYALRSQAVSGKVEPLASPTDLKLDHSPSPTPSPVSTAQFMRPERQQEDKDRTRSAVEAANRASEAEDESTNLNHLTTNGEAHMVSIANKRSTSRSATATSLLLFSRRATYGALFNSRLSKGDALAVARIAGIQAAKKTADLIPLAHPGLSITGATVRLEPFAGSKVPYPVSESFLQDPGLPNAGQAFFGGVLVTATVACEGKTGVEMEAIMAASVAGLTMYDMLKGVDKCMVLTSTRVTAKSGGKSGDWGWDHKMQQRIVHDKADVPVRNGADTKIQVRWWSDRLNGEQQRKQDLEYRHQIDEKQLIKDLEYQDAMIKRERIQRAVRENAARAAVRAENFREAAMRRSMAQSHAGEHYKD